MSFMNLIVFGGIGMTIAILYFVGIRIRNRQHDQRERRAKELGWTYNRTPSGQQLYEIRGRTKGVPWKIYSDPDYGFNKEPMDRRPTTTWVAKDFRTPYPLLITNVHLAQFIVSGEGRKVTGLTDFLISATGHNTPQSMQNFRIVNAGGARFRSQFAVLSSNENLAREFLSQELENALLRWPLKFGRNYTYDRCLFVHLDGHDVRVQYFHELLEMPIIEQLAEIGIMVLNRFKDKQ